MSQPSNWQNIIWREWRNTEDEEYARQLFELVADEPVGWQSTILLFLLGVLSGAIGGLILGIITIVHNVWSESHGGEVTQTLFMFTLAGSLIGSGIGLLIRFLLKKYFIWPELFFRIQLGIMIGLIAWLVGGPFVGMILGLIAGLMCLPISQLYRPDEPYFAPAFFVSSCITLIAGASVMLTIGLLEGLAIMFVVGPFSLPIGFLLMLNPKIHDTTIRMLVKWHKFSSIYKNRRNMLIEQLLQYDYYNWHFWWQAQPDMSDVEIALSNASAEKGIWGRPLRRLDRQKQISNAPINLIANLQSDYWITRFAARYALVALGGEAMLPLQTIIDNKDSPLYNTVIRLLENIEIETSNHLAEQAPNLVCPQCLVRCHTHYIRLSLQKAFTYHGCRACHQSREFIEHSGDVVAVLDQGWHEDRNQQNGLLKVNWLARRTLFDFDQVEIIQASDEEVERFAVQVGNDTDALREPRYKEMSCFVAPDCQLSENTWRILRSLFGEVGNG